MTNLATNLPHRAAFDAALPELLDLIAHHEHALIVEKVRGNWIGCAEHRAVLSVLRPLRETLAARAMTDMEQMNPRPA